MKLFTFLPKKTVIITEEQQKLLSEYTYNDIQNNQSARYKVFGKLAEQGYLFHGTKTQWDNFDTTRINGSNRANYGYGAYFTNATYKCEEYGEHFVILDSKELNILNLEETIGNDNPFTKKITQYNNISSELGYAKYNLDNSFNNDDYSYYSNLVNDLEEEYNNFFENDIEKTLYEIIQKFLREENNLTYKEINAAIRDKYGDKMDKHISSLYLNLGYDGFQCGTEFVIFNFNKLNQHIVKDVESLINSVSESKTHCLRHLNEMVSPIVWHFCWLDNLQSILTTNSFHLSQSNVDREQLPGVIGFSSKRPYYLCTTRSKNSNEGYSRIVSNDNQEGYVRLTLNGDNLNNVCHSKASDYFGNRDNKISQGKSVLYNKIDKSNKPLDKNRIQNIFQDIEKEDTVWYNKPELTNANKFIERIDIMIPSEESLTENFGILKDIVNKADSLSLPVFIYNNISDFDKQNNKFINIDLTEDSTQYYEILFEDEEHKFKPTSSWMQEMYYKMNEELFGGALGECILKPFTTGKGSNGNTLGWFRINGSNIKVKRSSRQIYKESYYGNIEVNHGNFYDVCLPSIELNANYAATETAWINTLVHEMCHYYTYMNGFAPKQGHGPEFRRIGEAVSARSNGLITIQRLATAEEMKDYELDANIVAKNQAKMDRKAANTIVSIVILNDKKNPNNSFYFRKNSKI